MTNPQHGPHLASHITKPTLGSDNTLHVVAMVSNPARYHSRYRLFRNWQKEMEATPYVKVYVVEVAFGDRQFEVTDPNNKQHLQLRVNQELWHKENAINRGVIHLLPSDWKYLCWCDGDIHFRNSEWAQEALHQLQHFPLIQPWHTAADLGFEGNITSVIDSFCSVNRTGRSKQVAGTGYIRPAYGHPGYAWCCTRKFYENVGGLIDFAILGAGDNHMAWGSINSVESSMPKTTSPVYIAKCKEWQHNAYRVTNGHLGYVAGTIEHNFHGSKKKRFYHQRWQLLERNKYNPVTNLMYDDQGMVVLINNPKLEDDIRRYMRARHEDSIDDEDDNSGLDFNNGPHTNGVTQN